MTQNAVASASDDAIDIFSAFVELSYGKLQRYALSLLSPSAAHIADDLVQEAYTRLLTHIRRGSPMFDRFEYAPEPTDMVRYMQVVVKHVYLDMVQYGRIEMQSVSLDHELELGDDSISMQLPDEYSNVEQVVLRQEAATEFNSHIALLPPRMRDVMQLKRDGLSSQEIASKLSISSSAIRVAFMRAKGSLRESMTEHTRQSRTRVQWNQVHAYGISASMVHEVAQLPDPYQTIVALHGIRHTSYREVAHSLNRSIGTVKSQYSRGKKLLENQYTSTLSLTTPAQELSESINAQLEYVERLDSCSREIVLLHYKEGLSYTAIARRLGRTRVAIKVCVSRAMHKLQNYIDFPDTSTTKKPSARRRNVGPIEDAIEHVHPAYRSVMQKYYSDLLPVSTIAKELEISQSVVKYRLRAANQCLKEVIEDWDNIDRRENC